MNILFLYGATQTFTNTVFEHVNSFAQYSRNKFYYCHQDQYQSFDVDISQFGAVFLHYSVRLPYDQVPEQTASALEGYPGLKVLFIQDEYDHTSRTWYWIKRLGFQLVFTVVPPEGIARVYPPERFPGVRFVSNLTGYVPDEQLPSELLIPSSSRNIMIGYRGRRLPVRYGLLGQEKIEIGRQFKRFCKARRIAHDIEWTEEARIYGPKWYEFLASCRSMLGSESGSNVFDWDGTLLSRIDEFKRNNRKTTDDYLYRSLIEPLEIPNLMNQISPRIFEAIQLRTVLVLYEGRYSGVVTPMQHFIPVRKDGSNLDEVVALLMDDNFVDAMADRAYQDVIISGKFSYQSYVQMVDREITASFAERASNVAIDSSYRDLACVNLAPAQMTTYPLRASVAKPTPLLPPTVLTLLRWAGIVYLWQKFPSRVKVTLRSRIRNLRYVLLKGKYAMLRLLYRVWASFPTAVKGPIRRLLQR